MRNWLAHPLPEELAALDRLPEEMKNDARQSLREYVNRQSPKPKLSPQVQRFLEGQAIIGAAQARSPGRQIRDLRAIQERHGDNPAMPIGPE